MKVAVCFGLIGLGFALLLASGLWTTFFPGTSAWTAEKAERSAAVKNRLATLSFQLHAAQKRMHGGPDPAQLKTEYDALFKENEQLNAEFESIASRRHTIPRIFKWAGISLAIVGVVGWYAVKDA